MVVKSEPMKRFCGNQTTGGEGWWNWSNFVNKRTGVKRMCKRSG